MAVAVECGVHKTNGAVLILGNYRQTIAAVRSLRQAGYKTVLGHSEDEPAFAKRSRDVNELWEHPPFHEAEKFCQALNAYLAAHPGMLVFPLGDSNSEVLAQHHQEFPGVRFCMPEPESVLHSLDKLKMADTAAKAGVPVPPTMRVKSLPDLQDGLKKMPLPWAIKPRDSNMPGLLRKALFIETEDDIDRLFPVWPAGVPDLLVQRKISGLRYNVDFAARSGSVLSMSHFRVLRVDSIDYSGVAVDAVSVPLIDKISKYTTAIITALNYTGIGLMQFLHEESEDDYYFLELNPRLGAVAAGPCYVGFDVPRWAVALADGTNTVLPEKRDLRNGLRCNWMTGDLAGLFHSARTGEVTWGSASRWLLNAIKSFLAADCHCTWQMRDPLPTLAALHALVASALRHLRHAPVISLLFAQ
jgi:predicted ATP-grasp superfamily ATP-dependent carboligase